MENTFTNASCVPLLFRENVSKLYLTAIGTFEPVFPLATVRSASLVMVERPTGLTVFQVTDELQVEAPLNIMQEVAEIVPRVELPTVHALPLHPVPPIQVAVTVRPLPFGEVG